MPVDCLQKTTFHENIGDEMHALARRLFPIHRSQTGDGLRQTLSELKQLVPLQIEEVPSGTKVFDWEVPKEWSIRDAYISSESGERFIDYRNSNLHVVNGSRPINARMTFGELEANLHTVESNPDWIPYRTCFMRDDWGFCLSQNQLQKLRAAPDQQFNVVIDSSFEDGSMSYGELLLPSKSGSGREILIYTHICHPSLGNDNLSGIVVATFLAKQLIDHDLDHSIRFAFAPATIGAIAWLARNQESIHRIDHGLVLSLLGDSAPFTYKQSRRGNADVDRAVELLFSTEDFDGSIREFTPFGYDERQFCSPGINLPMGCLMRSPNGEFNEYHTSGDNLSFIKPKMIAESLRFCERIVHLLDQNQRFLSTNPNCEPRLGTRGIDLTTIGPAIQWLLNLADGSHDLIDVCVKSKLSFTEIQEAARQLVKHDLIRPQDLKTS